MSKETFIPSESEIKQLIGICSSPCAAFLQIAMETGGIASSEIKQLKWADVDSRKRTVRIGEERGQIRIITVSAETINRVNALPRQHGEFLFNQPMSSFRSETDRVKRKLADALQNPRLRKINFHSLRHRKGMTEYCKTRDILHVQRLMGMRSVENTLCYVHLCDFNVKCPGCGLGPDNIAKNGTQNRKDGSKKQRWLCGSCGKRFTTDLGNSQKNKSSGGAA